MRAFAIGYSQFGMRLQFLPTSKQVSVRMDEADSRQCFSELGSVFSQVKCDYVLARARARCFRVRLCPARVFGGLGKVSVAEVRLRAVSGDIPFRQSNSFLHLVRSLSIET